MNLRKIHRLTMTIQEVAERNEIEPLELLEVAKMLAATAIHQTGACEHNRQHIYEYLISEVERVTETLCGASERLEAQEAMDECGADAWLAKIPDPPPDSGFDIMAEPPQIVDEWTVRKPGEGGES